MKTDKRELFLLHFLKLFGVDKVEITKSERSKIYGVATYLDDEETQEFCWHKMKEDEPQDDLFRLLKVIKDNKFNQHDKIIVSANRLFEMAPWTDRAHFNIIYDRLFDIEIKMIDEGEETDSYFLHE